MTRWVGLLYSVVLTSDRRVTKADLLAIAETAGVAEARTVLSTGNLIFEAEADEVTLEARLGAAVTRVLGRALPVFVRSAKDLRAILRTCPIDRAASMDPARIGVRILRNTPSAEVAARVAVKSAGGEEFGAVGRTFWVASPDALSGSALFRAAGAPWAGEGTFRSLSALRKIAAAMGAD